MSQKTYWQGFGQINDPESARKHNHDEFKEDLPFEDFDSKSLIDAKAPRRDFLKYLGFSTAAATLAASCTTEVRKAVPYADKPEQLIAGESKYYATTFAEDGEVTSVLAKVRDGRPIKLEGNDLGFTNGGTSARVQASVLDLYDTHRIKFPLQKVSDKFEETTFKFIDGAVAKALTAGGTTVLLTQTINSPSALEIIGKFPNLQVVNYDGISYSGMLSANEQSGFGRVLPSYRFDNADIIVSLSADFLGTWLNAAEQSAAYVKGRTIDEKAPKMSKHYQFEGYLSLTGSSADERIVHKPSQTGAIAVALLAAVGGSVSAPSIADAKVNAAISKIAGELKAAQGKAVVVCGSNDANVQTVVNAINSAIGAFGTTIDFSAPLTSRKGDDKAFADLMAQMEAGTVGTLIIHNANPAYDYVNADQFKKALSKVKNTISLGYRLDETTALCKFIAPTHHYLESWGDAEVKGGTISFVQPTINPLFKTRQFQDSLLIWSGSTTTYDVYVKDFWSAKLGGESAFNKVLQEGVYKTTAATAGSYTGGSLAAAATAIAAYPAASKDEIVLYQKTAIGGGAGATNPWLQELPDGVTRATWGNYALISMAKANELGIKLDTDYEYHPEKPVIKITAGNKSVELPILVMPGMNANTIAVAVGYGRNETLGVTAAGVGKNIFNFASSNGTNVLYDASGITIENTGRKETVAQTQIHNSYEGRVEVLRETTLGAFKQTPNEFLDFRNQLKATYGKGTNDFRKGGTLYGDHDKPGIKWGMNIDMNACIGCGACVISCHTENNVSVVGKSEVLRYHDMHWLRIDRYFISDENNPDDLKGVVFQPMMCQHCDNAPCENVCPVAATNHSAEGINQMAYNRCIGTRYCANNCPYKVRRFNWADYTGADSFKNNQDQKIVGKLDPVVHQMNEDLSRMVLNPDVTVRSRGVMEKCSFCIQRLQHAKLEAKKDNRPLKDGEAVTACQQACPTNAIVFGDTRTEETAISIVRANNPQRLFYSLEQLHVLPNVSYLAKIRNSEEIIEKEGSHAAAAHGEEAKH